MGHTNRIMAQASANQRSKLETGGINCGQGKVYLRHMISRAQKDNNYSKRDLDQRIVDYVQNSSEWLNITDDQGDWDDVVTYTNSNRTASFRIVCSSYISLTIN